MNTHFKRYRYFVWVAIFLVGIILMGCRSSKTDKRAPTSTLAVSTQRLLSIVTPTTISEPTRLLTATAPSLTAETIPITEIATSTPVNDATPRGLVFEHDDLLVSHNSQGLEIAIDEIRILDQEAVFVETFLDQPALWDKQTIIEIAYTLTNATNADLIESSPWALMVFGDADGEQFEVIRLADYHAITPDGMVLSPGIGDPVVLAGETKHRFLRVGLERITLDDIATLQWVFDCPMTQNSGCYGAPKQRYETIVDIKLGAGELLEFEHKPALGLNITQQVTITRGGIEVRLERLFSAPVETNSGILYRSDLFDTAKSAIFLGIALTNYADQPRFLLPEIGHLMIGDTPEADYGNVINFTPFFRAGLAFSNNGYYPHLNPEYKKTLVQTPLVLQPGEQVYLGAWLGSEVDILPGDSIEIFLGCAFPLTDNNLDAEDGFFPDCLSDEHGETYNFKLILPDEAEFDYESYTTAWKQIAEVKSEPLVSGIAEFPAVETCQDIAAIENVLGESVPEDQWGIQYRDNDDNPPELSFYGVSSGAISALKVRGSNPNSLHEIDLAQLYYLDSEGQLQTIWMSTGVTTEQQEQKNYISFVGGLSDRQDVLEIMRFPGQFFETFTSADFVEPDGIAWERCYHNPVSGFFNVPCEIGLLIEEELGWDSRKLVSGGKFSTDLAYGWTFNPQGSVLEICPGEMQP